jgi:hypothetical protein
MGKFNFSQEEFDKVKNEAENLYRNFELIYCPYFREKISFNAKGLRHLKFKSDQQARPYKDQYPRLKLLYLAPKVLSQSHTLQGIWETKSFEQIKNQGRWQYLMKNVVYYEFIAVIENVRVKVIVKQIEGGERYFWSVIPNWGIDKLNSKRILHEGDPEFD